MNNSNRFVTLFLLSAALAAPAGLAARSAKPQDAKSEEKQAKAEKDQAKADKDQAKADKSNRKARYYDAKHNTYHEWTASEDRAYRHYLDDQHQTYRDFQRENAEQQAAYWQWRADHPDDR